MGSARGRLRVAVTVIQVLGAGAHVRRILIAHRSLSLVISQTIQAVAVLRDGRACRAGSLVWCVCRRVRLVVMDWSLMLPLRSYNKQTWRGLELQRMMSATGMVEWLCRRDSLISILLSMTG